MIIFDNNNNNNKTITYIKYVFLHSYFFALFFLNKYIYILNMYELCVYIYILNNNNNNNMLKCKNNL